MTRMKHGTRSMYVTGLCRCEDCTTANTEYQWAANRRRARALAAGAAFVEHGTLSTYTNHRCRCGPCTEANSARCRDYARRRKAAQAP